MRRRGWWMPAILGAIATLVAGCAAPGTRADERPASSGRAAAPPTARQAVVSAPGPPRLPPGVITHGPRTRRWVALTFDADMTRGMLQMLRSGRVAGWYDARLFDELRATHTPATIFLTGLWTAAYPAETRALARDPAFELENHSLDHAGWVAPCYGLPVVSGQPSKRAEIAGARRIIERIAGIVPKFFRFPGGCEDSGDVRLVESYGEHPVGWDVVSGDAFQSNAAVVVRNVLRGVRPGSIVIFHCVGAPNSPATAAALTTIVPALRARGYRFVTLAQLLGLRPAAQQTMAGGR